MGYIKQIWADGESGKTPITAEKLNHIEQGIYNNSTEIEKIKKYSTEEEIIGTYKDGRPIYRKLMFDNQRVTNGAYDDVSDLNIDIVIKRYGSAVRDGGTSDDNDFGIPFYDNENEKCNVLINKENKLTVWAPSNVYYYVTATFEYVKTTD